jgi:SulP family sulfate permease
MSAVVADRMSGDRHNSNMELIAQGLANIASPLAGGLPATGAIARTATNIRSGARTPIAGIVHALTLLTILLVAAPLAGAIPLAVLAAILMVVAWNMGEWTEIPELLRLTKTDVAVWVVTFLLTVFADLTAAVEVGMILAALLFIRRVAETTTVSAVTDEYVSSSHVHSLLHHTLPPYTRIFRVHGPFLFGATEKLRVIHDDLDSLPEIVVLRLRNMTAPRWHWPARFEEADTLHASGRT